MLQALNNIYFPIKKVSGGEVIVSPTEPTGENRKPIWYQKGKNLFNKNNPSKLLAFIKTEINALSYLTVASGIIVPIKPSTEYTISRIAGNSFRIATLENLPILRGLPSYEVEIPNGEIISTHSNHTGTSITITSEENANYLYVFYCSLQNGDTNADEEKIRNSIQIEEGSEATEYEEYIEPKLYMLNNNDEYIEMRGN